MASCGRRSSGSSSGAPATPLAPGSLPFAAAVPQSLGKQTNIDAILQAADDIVEEDPNVARICEFLTSTELNFSVVVLEMLYLLEI